MACLDFVSSGFAALILFACWFQQWKNGEVPTGRGLVVGIDAGREKGGSCGEETCVVQEYQAFWQNYSGKLAEGD